MDIKKSQNNYIKSVLLSILLIFSGCLERSETIQIDKQGNATIIAEFDGNEGDFAKSASFPTMQLWKIIENKKYNDREGNLKNKLKAEQVINYGTPFYSSYEENDNSGKTLLFPTELKMWKDGNKTYYKFTRTYKARTYARFNGPEELIEFEELEEKVTKEGIFNVSEKERNEYVKSLTEFIQFHNFYIYIDAIGIMIQKNNFSVSLKQTVSNDIKNYFEEYITNQRLLDILRLEDSLIDKEYEIILQEIEAGVTKIISRATSVDQSIPGSPFKEALKEINFEFQVTEALTSDKFTIYLGMPGEIISTNGFTDFDKPGKVYWEFKGEALHDRDIPLYALSVVEH